LNLDLLDLYETYEDRLSRYGLVHFPGFVRQVFGEQAFDSYSNLLIQSNWAGFDTIVRANQLGALPCTAVDPNYMRMKTFRKLIHREHQKLSEDTLLHPYEAYWSTIDHSLSSLLNAPSPVDRTHQIPSDFVAYYGIHMSGKSIENIQSIDSLYPRHWCMHDRAFGGGSNFLTTLSDNLQGIASPSSYWYGGSLFTSFPYHFEDFWLPSVNFHYAGAEKYWIGTGAQNTRTLWRLIKDVAKFYGRKADEKKYILSPKLLLERAGVEVVHVHQQPGDMVISASGATHGGFNLGMNLAEAVNFADVQGRDGWLSMADDMQQFYSDERERSIPPSLLQFINGHH
jgi:hypothetical protein